jgi:hypothetical protein
VECLGEMDAAHTFQTANFCALEHKHDEKLLLVQRMRNVQQRIARRTCMFSMRQLPTTSKYTYTNLKIHIARLENKTKVIHVYNNKIPIFFTKDFHV